jgi:hypothetical protein
MKVQRQARGDVTGEAPDQEGPDTPPARAWLASHARFAATPFSAIGFPTGETAMSRSDGNVAGSCTLRSPTVLSTDDCAQDLGMRLKWHFWCWRNRAIVEAWQNTRSSMA